MSARTGLGPVEVALLLTLEDIGAGHDRPYRKSASVLAALEELDGVAPDYGYQVACDLAGSGVWLRLVDGHGNLGGPGGAPANPRYTEVRLTPIGALAVAAERSRGPALPIGLVNGTTYAGGTRPPFAPAPLLRALLALLDDATIGDDVLVATCGPPAFPGGCRVGGEVDAVVAGSAGAVRLVASVNAGDGSGGTLVISDLPPGVDPRAVAAAVSARAADRWPDLPDALAASVGLPITDVHDESRHGVVRIVCRLEDGAQPDAVARRLREEVWGIHLDVGVALAAPLPVLLRSWVDEHATSGTAAALRNLAVLSGGR